MEEELNWLQKNCDNQDNLGKLVGTDTVIQESAHPSKFKTEENILPFQLWTS